jgi:hypothetical protein
MAPFGLNDPPPLRVHVMNKCKEAKKKKSGDGPMKQPWTPEFATQTSINGTVNFLFKLRFFPKFLLKEIKKIDRFSTNPINVFIGDFRFFPTGNVNSG